MFPNFSSSHRRKSFLLILLLSIIAFIGIFYFANRLLNSVSELVVIPPEEIISEGDTYQLQYISAIDSVQWSSSSPKVATVSEDGILTALTPGNTIITLSNSFASTSLKITIEAIPPEIIENQIKISLQNKRMLLENPLEFTWISSDSSIITIDEFGWVCAQSEGSAVVQAITSDIIYRYEIEVVDTLANDCFYRIGDGTSVIQLLDTYTPSVTGLLRKDAIWESSDDSVASIIDGTIYPTMPGTCTIKIYNNATVYSFQITVEYNIPESIQSTSILGEHAFIYNLTDDILLYEKGGLDNTLYIASLTKLFTGYVALQHLNPDEIITPGAEIWACPKDSSKAGLEQNVSVTVQDLFAGLMLRSGNDCAYTLATAAGRRIAGDESLPFDNAIAIFMDEVNQVATEFGLSDTHFVTPDGYDAPMHYSSMKDMIEISKLAYNDPFIREICSYATYSVTFSNGKHMDWDSFVYPLFKESLYYCPYVTGMKTGTTTNAGKCIISSIAYNDKIYLIGSFGCKNDDDRYIDVLNLLNNYVFE